MLPMVSYADDVSTLVNNMIMNTTEGDTVAMHIIIIII